MHARRIALSLIAGTTISGGAVLGVSPVLAGAASTPTVQVQPSTNLDDGQAVTVTGSGFTPSASIAIVECQAGTVTESGCDISTANLSTTASTTGDFSSTYIVTRYIQVGGVTLDCAVSGTCALAAANLANTAENASTSLTFNPNDQTPPPLAIGATLAATGTVNTKTGVATLSGTLTCNEPASVSLQGDVSETYHRSIFTSYFDTTVTCTSSGTWTAVVPPQNGLFTHGTMTVNAEAYGFNDLTSSQVALTGSVALKNSNS